MSEPARSNGSQPMLSAEWIRQPENVELAGAFAAFAAHLASGLGVHTLRQSSPTDEPADALKHYQTSMDMYSKQLTPQQMELVQGYMADHNTLQAWLDDQHQLLNDHTPREWGQRMTQPLPPTWAVGAYEQSKGRDPRGLPTEDPAKGQHQTRIAWPGGSVEPDAPAPVGQFDQTDTDPATATGGMHARAE